MKTKEKSNIYVSILDISPKQVENTKGLLICDKCNKTFSPKNILMEKSKNISFQGLNDIKGITKGKNTYYMVSPCCKETHLFGFDIKKQEN